MELQMGALRTQTFHLPPTGRGRTHLKGVVLLAMPPLTQAALQLALGHTSHSYH